MDLTEFLLARIAEDEADALMANRGVPWHPYERPSCSGIWASVEPGGRGYRVATLPRAMEAGHIARWAPLRVLAECEAKRRIVEQLWDYVARPDPSSSDPSGTQALWIVKQLTLPYAGHPDYRSEWAP